MWVATLKGLLAHKLRVVLTALSIVLGVGFVTGTYVLGDTLTEFFDTVFAEANAGVDVVVRAEEESNDGFTRPQPVSEDVLDRVATVPGVKVASGDVGGYAQLVDRRGEPIGGQGPPTIGLTYPRQELSPLSLREGRPPQRDGEVAIDAVTARKEKFGVGDKVKILFVGPAEEFTVVGVVGFGKADNLGGATLAAFESDTARRVLHSEAGFTSLSVVADEGVRTADLIDGISDVLPAGYRAVSGQTSAQEDAGEIKEQITFLTRGFLFFAGISLFVGAFIIANTFSIILAQRTRELGLLRALGATGGQVLRSVLVESLLLAVVASIVGIVFGVGMGVGLRKLFEAIGGGADLPGADVRLLPRTVIAGLLIGVVVTLLAALAPARRAGRLTPVEALREGAVDTPPPTRRHTVASGVAAAVGCGLLALGMFGNDIRFRFGLLAAGLVLGFIGIARLSPFAARPLASALGAPLSRRGVAGTLARANATRSPQRTAATAAALMIGLALVSAATVLTTSMRRSVAAILEDGLKADLIVAPDNFQQAGFSTEVADRLRARPEIGVVVPFRADEFRFRDKRRSLVATDLARLDSVLDIDLETGPGQELGAGRILLHEDVATDLDLGPGQRMALEFPGARTREFEVAGTFSQRRMVLEENYVISTEDHDALYADRQDTVALVTAAPGTPAAAAQKAATAALADFPNLDVQDRDAFLEDREQDISQLLALVSALLLLAVIIALLGIATTLALSVFERTREIGLLRAVGMTRRQVRRMVRGEGVIVAVLGAVLGIAVGLPLGIAAVKALDMEVLSIPPGQLVVLVLAAGIAGLVAALFPARRAARLDVLAAITTE